MTRRISLTLAALLLSASAALAQPATEAGATRIKAAFATYLGSAAAAVDVVPQGDSYAMTLDASPLFLLGQAQGVTGRATPLILTLTDRGDGTWGVTMDQGVSVSASLPQVLDLTETVDILKLDGTFDESLVSFTRLSGSFAGISVVETIKTPGQPDTRATVALASGSFDSTTSANPAGGADTVYTATAQGLSEQLDAALDPGQPAMPMTIKADSMKQTGSMTGLRMDGLLPVLAWVVAHPETPDAAGRATVKGLIQAALPVFQTMEGTGSMAMLSVDTPMGALGVSELGFSIGLNGATPDGLVREGVTLKGLTLPAGLVPGWAEPLVPQDLSLEVQVTGYDAQSAITQALTALDTDPALVPDFQDKVLAALMPKGTVTVTLNPGGASNGAYALTWEGSLDAGPATEVPPFHAKVSLTGIDAVLKALNGAPDDMKMPAMMGLGAMRGIATKGEGGALVWTIDGTTPGTVLVNGMDISKIGQ